MIVTYKVTYVDGGDSEFFQNIREMRETPTDYVLVRTSGEEVPIPKDAVEAPPICSIFIPFSVPMNARSG